MSKKYLFREYDALSHRKDVVGDEQGAVNHVKKAHLKKKGQEIMFDAKAHK